VGEKKNYCTWFIVVLILWGLIGTGISFFFYNKYTSLVSIISEAGGTEFAEIISRQRETILTLQDDLGAIKRELESALNNTRELRDVRERIDDIVERTDGRLTEIEGSMGDDPDIFTRVEDRQQRIEEIIRRIRADN